MDANYLTYMTRIQNQPALSRWNFEYQITYDNKIVLQVWTKVQFLAKHYVYTETNAIKKITDGRVY